LSFFSKILLFACLTHKYITTNTLPQHHTNENTNNNAGITYIVLAQHIVFYYSSQCIHSISLSPIDHLITIKYLLPQLEKTCAPKYDAIAAHNDKFTHTTSQSPRMNAIGFTRALISHNITNIASPKARIRTRQKQQYHNTISSWPSLISRYNFTQVYRQDTSTITWTK
jgi:hypothetical protein